MSTDQLQLESNDLERAVKEQINIWTDLQKGRGISVSISSKAVAFLCLMIDSIETDVSKYWRSNDFEPESTQKYAISLIPNALNQ